MCTGLTYNTESEEVVIRSSLVPPLPFGLLLRKGPLVRVNDGRWSHHQSMTAPTQIPSL